MPSTVTKLDRLRAELKTFERVVVAYSGGVDSTFLAAVAHDELGRDALMVTAVSPSLARRELESAVALARAKGWQHRSIGTHEVDREEYARNQPDRCYWCKDTLFAALEPIASERDAVVAVGTNVDDLSEHRPGLRAAQERDARSPLVVAGLTKSEIRALSAELGLPTADKPAGPCLASRFAYGVRVTSAALRRIEAAEDFLHELGFAIVRVRDEGGDARVEVEPRLVSRALELERDITLTLRRLGYGLVTIDPRGYRPGSLNEALLQPAMRRS